jgi:Coenzyme PQQ synthesis protein D (PqqD)
MIFTNRKSKTPTAEQAMSAKPLRVVEVELKPTDAGGARLIVPMRSTGRFAWLVRAPAGATKTFELDAIGRFVWENCDGQTTVEQIIRNVAKRYNLSLREAQVPTMQFLRILAAKGLIGVAQEPTTDR